MPSGQGPGTDPNVPIPNIRDAIKDRQGIAQDLEKAVRPRDEARFAELASRYKASIDQLVQSVDGSQEAERTYAKNLDLAQRNLSRQLLQLQALNTKTPAAYAESIVRLIDAVTLARDSVWHNRKPSVVVFRRQAAGRITAVRGTDAAAVASIGVPSSGTIKNGDGPKPAGWP